MTAQCSPDPDDEWTESGQAGADDAKAGLSCVAGSREGEIP